MTAISADVRNKMDHSCNWRCCFGCKDITDEGEEQAIRVQQAAKIASERRHDLEQHEIEIREIHFRATFTPQQSPEHTPTATPRKEKPE